MSKLVQGNKIIINDTDDDETRYFKKGMKGVIKAVDGSSTTLVEFTEEEANKFGTEPGEWWVYNRLISTYKPKLKEGDFVQVIKNNKPAYWKGQMGRVSMVPTKEGVNVDLSVNTGVYAPEDPSVHPYILRKHLVIVDER